MNKTFILICGALLLAACSNQGKQSTATEARTNTSPTVQGNYRIISVKPHDKLSAEPTMLFQMDTFNVSGSTGCNLYFGEYQMQKDQLRFSNLAVTKKRCADDSVNRLEKDILLAFGQIERYQHQGDVLELLDAEDTVLMRALPSYIQ